jgi:hypothetical protein
MLKHSLKTFILEVGESKNVHCCNKKHYNEYREFLEKQEFSLNLRSEAFKVAISANACNRT